MESSGPVLITMLVLSPWLGLVTTWWAGRKSAAAARRSALANAWITASLATLLVAITNFLQQQAPADDILRGIQIPWWTIRSAATNSPPWSIAVVLSFGIESVNQPLLLMLPWLVISALILTPQNVSPRFYLGVLTMEACGMAHAAAQDAITALVAAECLMLVTWLMTGWFGGNERRIVAQRYLAVASFSQRFWWFGLIALAIAAAWSQLEFHQTHPAISFGWSDFQVTLPRFVSRYVSSFEYWVVTSWMITLVLAAGIFLRGPWVPCHTWLAPWIREAPPALVVLHLGVLGCLAAGLYLHAYASIWALNSVPFAWGLYAGALTAFVGGLLALSQTDLRKFVVYAWLSGQGWTWIGVCLGAAAAVQSGWISQLISALGTTSLMGVVLLLESRYQTCDLDAFGGLVRKCPRLTLAACLSGWFVATGAWFPRSSAVWAWQAAAFEVAPVCWLAGLAGQLLVAWATIWLLQRVFFGRLREPLHDPRFFQPESARSAAPLWHSSPQKEVLIEDLTASEAVAILIPLALQFVLVELQHGSLWP